MALPHADPAEVVDLRPLGPKLGETKTAAIVKSEQFEAVRLVVPAGTTISSHVVDGELTLHCLEGRAALGLPGGERELAAGEWLYLAGGTPHSVRGIEDASLLLTIMFPGRRT